MKWLIYGHNGWIGSYVCELLEKDGHDIIRTNTRADNEKAVEDDIITHNPDRVMSFIGRTHGEGINTIDYLEQPGKLKVNINDNLYAPVVLAHLCKKYNIHYTYLGTGCIFNGEGYTEGSVPNFFGSSYSTVKGFTDRIMHMYNDTVLNVRIRMPITSEMHARNFITKIMSYEKICSIPNSMSVLPTLLPLMIDMAIKKTTGTINLTNPGVITHNEILDMVKEYIKPNLTWVNFSLEEQSEVLKAGRSNNYLDTTKLETLYPDVPNIKEAVLQCVMAMKTI
jgi:dTDP-4-dehydrorhamnose reductase